MVKQCENWAKTREFVVVRKVIESEMINSYYLELKDKGLLAPFKPGQFLTFELDIPGVASPVIRSYSLSSAPQQAEYYRVTIKREPSPHGSSEVQPGLGSNYFHDCVEEGSTLKVFAPRGQFFLDEESERPIVLLSGGVGLTPMVSMLESLAASGSGRPVWFIHACDNGRLHAMGDHTRKLVESHEHFNAHFCYRVPDEADVLERDYDKEGFITMEWLQSLLPFGSYDFYLCGPTPFMQAMYKGLKSLDVPDERINYEFFGPSTILTESSVEASVVSKSSSVESTSTEISQSDGIQVQFTSGDKAIVWDDDSHSLLDFAEANGLAPNFSCRSGICNDCKCTLLEGEVEYFEEPLDMPADGEVLICCARPKTAVHIDI